MSSVVPSPPRENFGIRNPRNTSHQLQQHQQLPDPNETKAEVKQTLNSASDNATSLYLYSPSSMLSIQTPMAEEHRSLDGCLTPHNTNAINVVERELNPPTTTANKQTPSVAATTATADHTDDNDGDSSDDSDFSLDEDSLSLQRVAHTMRLAATEKKKDEISMDKPNIRKETDQKHPSPTQPQQLSPALLSDNSTLSDFIAGMTTPSPSRPDGLGPKLYPIAQSPNSKSRNPPVHSANEFTGLTPLAISLLEESIQRGLEMKDLDDDASAIFGDRALANALRRITDERKDGYVRYGNTVVPAAAVERFERSETALTLSTQLDELSLRASPSFGRKNQLTSPGFNPVGSANSLASLHNTYRQELANVMGSSFRSGGLATPSRRALSASPARNGILSNDFTDAFGGTVVIPLSLTNGGGDFNATINTLTSLGLQQGRRSVSSFGSPIPVQQVDVIKVSETPTTQILDLRSPLPNHSPSPSRSPSVTPELSHPVQESAVVAMNAGVTRLTFVPSTTVDALPQFSGFVPVIVTSPDAGSSCEVIDYHRIQSSTMKPEFDLKECFPASPIYPKARQSIVKTADKTYKSCGSASRALLRRKSSKNSTLSEASSVDIAHTRTPSPAPTAIFLDCPMLLSSPESDSPNLKRDVRTTSDCEDTDLPNKFTIFQGKKMTIAERDRRIQQETERVEKLRNRAAAYLSYEQKGRKVLEKLESAPQISNEHLTNATARTVASTNNLLRGTFAGGPKPSTSRPSHLSPLSHRPRPLSAN